MTNYEILKFNFQSHLNLTLNVYRFTYQALILFFLSFLQIEAADKQLKATRLFLEDQATEREHERDEFSKEIEKLRIIVKEKDKDLTLQDNHQKEVTIIIYLRLLVA